MEIYQDKFQRLLREPIQFDCADLDFSIYRIMNRKRDVIEKKLTEGAYEILVNGDSFIPNAKALEPLSRRVCLHQWRFENEC